MYSHKTKYGEMLIFDSEQEMHQHTIETYPDRIAEMQLHAESETIPRDYRIWCKHRVKELTDQLSDALRSLGMIDSDCCEFRQIKE